MVSPLISVIFTCKGRPELTELCLRRFVELMPQPYELIIAYDGKDPFYETMLHGVAEDAIIIENPTGRNRFALINDAVSCAEGPYYMHLENDFYWVDWECLDDALIALKLRPEIDYIRFELLPFTAKDFYKFETIGVHDVCWMKKTTPYRFTFNPHIRRFKFPGSRLLKTDGFSKQPEQHFNDIYDGNSCCMTGDNWRHLGIYDEGKHFKEYYAERFYNQRGKRETNNEEMLQEFDRLTDNVLYRKLFKEYLLGSVW